MRSCGCSELGEVDGMIEECQSLAGPDCACYCHEHEEMV